MGSISMESYHVGQAIALGIGSFLKLSPEEQAVAAERVLDVLKARDALRHYTHPTPAGSRNLFGELLDASKKLIEALEMEKQIGFSDYRVNVTRKNYRQS